MQQSEVPTLHTLMVALAVQVSTSDLSAVTDQELGGAACLAKLIVTQPTQQNSKQFQILIITNGKLCSIRDHNKLYYIHTPCKIFYVL